MHQSDNFLKLKYLVLVRVWGNRHSYKFRVKVLIGMTFVKDSLAIKA